MSMRLVSQNKEFDIPYDRVAVNISIHDNTEIIAYDINADPYSLWIMGKYPNKEMALFVMKQLRKAYKTFVIEYGKDRSFLVDPIFEFPAAERWKCESKSFRNRF